MSRDVFEASGRCHYCDRAARIAWDIDLHTCGHEMCDTLAHAELHRRHPTAPVPQRHGWVRRTAVKA